MVVSLLYRQMLVSLVIYWVTLPFMLQALQHAREIADCYMWHQTTLNVLIIGIIHQTVYRTIPTARGKQEITMYLLRTLMVVKRSEWRMSLSLMPPPPVSRVTPPTALARRWSWMAILVALTVTIGQSQVPKTTLSTPLTLRLRQEHQAHTMSTLTLPVLTIAQKQPPALS